MSLGDWISRQMKSDKRDTSSSQSTANGLGSWVHTQLSQRQTDELAKEFVRLKSECRHETESTLASSASSQQINR